MNIKLNKMCRIIILSFLFLLFSCGPSKEEVAKATRTLIAKQLIQDSIKEAKKEADLIREWGANYKFRIDSVNKEASNIKDDYIIITTNHHPRCLNYHVVVKFRNKSKVEKFLRKFKAKFCDKNCTITLYDSGSVKKLMTKYPLTKQEYRKLATHTIASLDWELDEVIMNPYKDAFN